MARKSQRRGPADPSSPDATGAPRDDRGAGVALSPERFPSSGSLSSAHLPEELRPHLVDRAPRLGRHEREAPVEASRLRWGWPIARRSAASRRSPRIIIPAALSSRARAFSRTSAENCAGSRPP